METQSVVQASTSDIKLFLDTLVKLEQRLETEVKPFTKVILDTYGSFDLFSKFTRESTEVTRMGHHYYKHKTTGKQTGVQWHKSMMDTYINLHPLNHEYTTVIYLTYFKYLETATTTISDIKDLENRYKLFLTNFKEFTSPVTLRFNCYSNYINCSIGNDYLTNSQKNNYNYLISTLGSKFTKFNSNYPPALTIPFITNPKLLLELTSWADNLVAKNAYNQHQQFTYSLINLFEDTTISYRLYLATILDNSSLLKSFLEECSTHNPNKSIIDLINDYSLAGIAAANGCIEVMKYFIELKISLERKFTLDTNKATLESRNIYQIGDSKSTLTHSNYSNCTLEMTPLALVLSAAPALKREKACNMIELLLAAGANYNAKVIKTWTFTHGYYTHLQTTQKASSISLFNFDQTGLLDELVKKQNEINPKFKPKYEKTNNRHQFKKVLAADNHSKDIGLQSTVEQLKKANMSLEEEVAKLRQENAALKREVEALKSNPPKRSIDEKQVITIQKLFRRHQARKNYSITNLKAERKKEILAKSSEVMGKLANEGKFEQITKLATAIKYERYHEAMQIMRDIPEQEIELNNGFIIKY